MRPLPRSWDAETLVCAVRGHVLPAAAAARLVPEDASLGVDGTDGTRLSRCLRCDTWVRSARPTGDEVHYDRLPPVAELPRPRRGRSLDDVLVTRLIAVERFLHVVLFTALAVTLAVVDTDLGGLREDARSMAESLSDMVSGSSRGGGHAWLVERLDEVAGLRGDTIRLLLIGSVVYAVLEGAEAIGLWLGKRWAEYLTVVATAGFLPIELRELSERVTVTRVVLLGVNVAVLVYLVWAKRLFGLRGGREAAVVTTDWGAVLGAAPPSAGEVTRSR
jgi:uncharacterized membrane protein (DUF2068 family)